MLLIMKKRQHSRLCFLLIVLCGVHFSSFGQQKLIPLNRFSTQEVERATLRDSISSVHLAAKPFLESKLKLNAIVGFAKDDTLKTYYNLTNTLLKQHLIVVKGDDYFIAVDPIFDLAFGKDFADTSGYKDTINPFNSTRGFQVIGDLGKKFSFLTSFYETQTYLPLYQKEFFDSTGVAPGFGRTKAYRAVGYDFAMAYGIVSYTPKDWVNIQFGHGKNFIGHGYRSLLLSDAAFNYPYIKTTLSFFNNKLQYSAMYASLQTMQRLPLGEVPEALFKRKGGSFNYLSWLPHERIEVGLFEGIIWQRYDNEIGTVAQPYGAYIPVIGVNTAINGFNAKQNVLVGANLRVKATEQSYIYGQVALDNPEKQSVGYQIGGKYFDLFIPRLDLQVEWNSLGAYMYASEFPLQNYVHINQPLGHPTGAATDELIVIGNYRWRRIIAQVKYNQIQHNTGPQGNWKSNPMADVSQTAEFPNHYIQQFDISAGVYVNPKWNFQILLGYINRLDQTKYQYVDDIERRTSFLYITLRTNLINKYNDF